MATDPPADRNHDAVEIRDRIPCLISDRICSSILDRVSFHHPSYDSTRLIELSAFDGPNGGIHYGTALLVCGIIAGNIWDGWLTEGRRGNKVELDKEAVLRGRDYFFHVPWPPDTSEEERSQGAYKYPIVPSFQHWTFPHYSPPPGWNFNPDLTANVASLFPVPSISSVSQAVRDRDGSCRLSGYRDGIERAHLYNKPLLPSDEKVPDARKDSPGESREEESGMDGIRYLDGRIVILGPQIGGRGEEMRHPLIQLACEDECTDIERKVDIGSEC